MNAPEPRLVQIGFQTMAPRNLQYSHKGIPILSLTEKAMALEAMLSQRCPEDADGHLWDLLNFNYDGKVPDDWVAQMRAKFGPPTPIAV
jgi:hypothetical protein